METITEDYNVRYDSAAATVFCGGSLRLDGIDAYRTILDILNHAAQEAATLASALTIDLSALIFLNSSGISMLSMFVVSLRDRGQESLILKGSSKILWQTRSLKNLQRLMPSISLILE